ncbi:hypothetical protein N0V90_004395 [Kalmusia sp. IMI 367209]|nr:hypothetical protein N0V90_004395 [Kalmusia sp. IMI 367209]
MENVVVLMDITAKDLRLGRAAVQKVGAVLRLSIAVLDVKAGSNSLPTVTSPTPKPGNNGTSNSDVPKSTPSSSYSGGNNGAYPAPIDCENPDNAQKCGSRYPAYGCPHDLKGDFESPYLIAPVDKAQPDKVASNTWNGSISDHTCTLYNFNIESRHLGKKCSLIWLFPEENDPETSSYTFNAKPNSSTLVEFWHLHYPAMKDSAW